MSGCSLLRTIDRERPSPDPVRLVVAGFLVRAEGAGDLGPFLPTELALEL